MVKINTVWRLLLTILLVVGLAVPVAAQSVLNFPQVVGTSSTRTGFNISNPLSIEAAVDFTLYALDGTKVSGLVNPVRYSVPPGGALSMSADEVFASNGFEGWVQVTSRAPGLRGVLFYGDFESTLESSPEVPALSDQLVPLLSEASGESRELHVVNASSQTATVNVALFNERGEIVGTIPANLNPKAGISISLSDLISLPSGSLTARVTSSVPVAAQASITSSGSLMLVNGQSVAEIASLRIAPHVILGNGFSSTLVLTNPTGQVVTVFLTLLDERGGPVLSSLAAPLRQSLTIPANGSRLIGASQLSGLLFTPAVSGWIRIESPRVPLGGALILTQGTNSTIYPLHASPRDDVSFPQLSEADGLVTGVVLLNPETTTASITVTLMDPDGNPVARSEIDLEGNSKKTVFVRDILPGVKTEGFLVLRSDTPVFGLEVVGHSEGSVLAAVLPRSSPPGFVPGPVVIRPVVRDVSPRQGRPGEILRVQISNLGDNSTVLFGDQAVPTRFLAPGIAILAVEVPDVRPGYFNIRIRSEDGTYSEPQSVLVLSRDATQFSELSGRAFYEKVEADGDGLRLARPVMVPIRGARVDVVNRQTGALVSVAETDDRGWFRTAVPIGQDSSVRVLSRSRSSELVVADNTNGSGVFFVDQDLDSGRTPVLIASDQSRVSGAFNILDVIRRGNLFLAAMDPTLPLPEVTLFWSPNNTTEIGNVADGHIGGTFFNVADNTAFVLGDRSVDSDEFDDAVILHEYAHLLAARFSGDDSPGGQHLIGDVLDPRVAWSEGWANFFSAAVRNQGVYLDSFGQDGAGVLEFDLEDNTPAGDRPGYWSEFSVHSILWDLYDDAEDPGDTVTVPFRTLWGAFTGLRNDSFVYLPTFLDRLAAADAGNVSLLEQIVRLRSVDFLSAADPSVSNPFPRIVPGTGTVAGEVDSLSRHRGNLATSAHLYTFDVEGGAVSIRLDVTGLGAGRNPQANDLDLFLMDEAGRVIGRSDRGLNGQSELISTFLPEGSYVIEIRSFYTLGQTGELIFNSGSYQLQIRSN